MAGGRSRDWSRRVHLTKNGVNKRFVYKTKMSGFKRFILNTLFFEVGNIYTVLIDESYNYIKIDDWIYNKRVLKYFNPL